MAGGQAPPKEAAPDPGAAAGIDVSDLERASGDARRVQRALAGLVPAAWADADDERIGLLVHEASITAADLVDRIDRAGGAVLLAARRRARADIEEARRDG